MELLNHDLAHEFPQMIGKMRAGQKLGGQIGDAPCPQADPLIEALHRAVDHAIAHGEGERQVVVMRTRVVRQAAARADQVIED